MPDVPELSPTEFRERWPGPLENAPVTLLDVREPAELALAAVKGALHVPMGQVPSRLHELDASKPIVVMCHAGGRSRRVAEFLRQQGFENVFNLRGGIDAWSLEVDPRVPRY
ncbi:MAG TPA: rhodanese-like domain-containing protein [Gammaproteobacteria bacterium]